MMSGGDEYYNHADKSCLKKVNFSLSLEEKDECLTKSIDFDLHLFQGNRGGDEYNNHADKSCLKKSFPVKSYVKIGDQGNRGDECFTIRNRDSYEYNNPADKSCLRNVPEKSYFEVGDQGNLGAESYNNHGDKLCLKKSFPDKSCLDQGNRCDESCFDVGTQRKRFYELYFKELQSDLQAHRSRIDELSMKKIQYA